MRRGESTPLRRPARHVSTAVFFVALRHVNREDEGKNRSVANVIAQGGDLARSTNGTAAA